MSCRRHAKRLGAITVWDALGVALGEPYDPHPFSSDGLVTLPKQMQDMDGPSVHRIEIPLEPKYFAPISRPAAMRPGLLYIIEALASAGTNLLVSGIYFYMTSHYGWGLLENFLLASSQGVIYISSALMAHKVAGRLGNRNTLLLIYALMSALAMACLLARSSLAVACLLLLYSGLSVITWPILEGLVSAGLDSHLMSRRISRYNLVWAAVGVFMLAI